MNEYTLTDDQGNEFSYAAADLRMALVGHQQLHGTNVREYRASMSNESERIKALRARVVELQEGELAYLRALSDTRLYDFPMGQIEAFRRVIDAIDDLTQVFITNTPPEEAS